MPAEGQRKVPEFFIGHRSGRLSIFLARPAAAKDYRAGIGKLSRFPGEFIELVANHLAD